MIKTKSFTRRELYELVWATPLSTLALQFGLSDRGLAKICKRHRVPTPPRGYWAKLAAGAKPKRTVFVETHDAELDRVEINSSLSTVPAEAREIIERAKFERAARRASKTAKVSEQVPRPPKAEVSPILKATASALRMSKPRGVVALSGAGLVALRVSR